MYVVFALLGSIEPLHGPVDIHLPDKEELWMEWVEAQEEAERDEGTRFEVEYDDGSTEEISIG